MAMVDSLLFLLDVWAVLGLLLGAAERFTIRMADPRLAPYARVSHTPGNATDAGGMTGRMETVFGRSRTAIRPSMPAHGQCLSHLCFVQDRLLLMHYVRLQTKSSN